MAKLGRPFKQKQEPELKEAPEKVEYVTVGDTKGHLICPRCHRDTYLRVSHSSVVSEDKDGRLWRVQFRSCRAAVCRHNGKIDVEIRRKHK